MTRYSVGKNAECAKNHAICNGPIVVAVVTGTGYPIGKGWSADSEALARRICDLLNAAEPRGALAGVLDYAERYGDLNDEGPDGDCAKSCATVRALVPAT